MLLFDNHNHSQFSFDGKRASIEGAARKAAERGLAGIAFTDHCDFYVPDIKAEYEKPANEVFNVAAQQQEIDRVQHILSKEAESEGIRPIKILKGAEVGIHELHHEDIREWLMANQFDQIIASIHYLDDTDPYYGCYYDDKDWRTAYGHYLETIYRELTWLQDFDIMGHYDYVVRYAPYPVTSIRYKDFSDVLDEMLRYLIYEGKALEVNTKSYQTYKGREVCLDLDILKRYQELGGEIISFGSDSHEPDRIGHNFRHFAELIKSIGFRWSAHYEHRKLIQLPL